MLGGPFFKPLKPSGRLDLHRRTLSMAFEISIPIDKGIEQRV
jgi:hypothetical protein